MNFACHIHCYIMSRAKDSPWHIVGAHQIFVKYCHPILGIKCWGEYALERRLRKRKLWMQRTKINLLTSAFLDLLLCVLGEVIPYYFTLKFHTSQAARQERGRAGTEGENNLTVINFHKHTHCQG